MYMYIYTYNSPGRQSIHATRLAGPMQGAAGARLLQLLPDHGLDTSVLQCVAVCCSVLQCDMTYSYVTHDWFICMTWHVHLGDMQGVAGVRLLYSMCDKSYSYVRHNTFVYGTWCIDMCVTRKASPAMAFAFAPWMRTWYTCVAVCSSVLQCVAVCCRVLPCVAVCCSVAKWLLCNRSLDTDLIHLCCSVLHFLQCVAVCCSVVDVGMWLILHSLLKYRLDTSMLQRGAVCCSVLQCVAVCCSVLQCVAVWLILQLLPEYGLDISVMQRVAVWRDTFIFRTRRIHMRDMTISYVRHDSFMQETWLIHIRHMTPWHMWHIVRYDACEMWRFHTWDMTHSCVCHAG